MELTPELFEKIEFTERRKGYDTEQVETFLEDAGTALAQLLARARHTEERAAHAEARLAEADARITGVQEQAAQIQAQAQAKVDQAQASVAAARSASALNEEAEVEQAAKTLLMARRTAEAMENEARGQAQALLGEAKARADRQLGEAQAEAEELIRRARSQAETEFADRRSRALEEIQGLESRRAQLADVITQLEARLAAYREDLTRTAEELTLLAADPDRLGARPTLSIPPDEVLTPRGGHDPVVTPARQPDPLPERAPEPQYDQAVASGAGTGSGATSDAAAPGPGQEQIDLHVDLGDGPATEAHRTEEAGSEDRWGPGSWSRVESVDDQDAVVDVGGMRSGVPEVVAEETISLADEPSGRRAAPEVHADPAAGSGRDRYLKDLDDAVIESDAQDEAMTAFFEGTSDSRNRRFGWRR